MSFTCKEPKLRFPEFCGEWEEKALGDLIQSLDAGISVNSTERPAKSNEKSILKTSCVSYDIFDISENKVVLDDIEIQRLKEPVTANSIIISRMNTPALVGANAFVKYDNLNTFLPDRLWAAKIRKDASPLWTSILISSTKIRTLLSERATGTSNSMKNITKGDVLTLPIVAPSKPEQEKIASFLTAVDAKIEQLTCKAKTLEKYKKSVLQKLFSQELRFTCNDGSEYPEWEEKKLGEVGQVITGKTPSTSNDDFWDGDIQFITPTDINENTKYQILTARKIVKQPNTKVLPKGSIVYTCIASIGKMAITTLPSITNQQINSIIAFENVNNEFLYYVLLKLTPYIKSTQANTTLPIINKTEFSKFKIQLPSLAEQTKIANFLSAIDEKCLHVKSQLAQTQQFKKALLQQMFV